MVSSDAQKRRYAHDSWAFNQRDPLVRKMFPELLESPEPLPELDMHLIIGKESG